jgi:hypothetical protein
MPSHPRSLGPRAARLARRVRPCLIQLEPRVVPSVPGIAGITLDATGDVFVSYDSAPDSPTPQESIEEFDSSGNLTNTTVIGTPGPSAAPGALATVGPSAALPSIAGASDDSAPILELQPNGQLFVFYPESGVSSQYDNLASYTPNALKVYDVQTGASVNLSSQISLTDATFGDFGVYQNSLVVATESNNWDFVMRLTYGSSGGVATVLVASPVSDRHPASPQGVAVDSTGMVLTTLPYAPAPSGTTIDAPVGFNLFYDTGSTPAPFVATLGLTSVPDIESSGIAVDQQNNFLVAESTTSLYAGGPGVVHINSALTALVAVPNTDAKAILSAIAYQKVAGTDTLAFIDSNSDPTDPDSETYTVRTELPLFSGQISPETLRHAYGVDQIRFAAPGGAAVLGDGSGQTIAIVEAGIDPTLGADLNTFDEFFGISPPPSFTVVDQTGATQNNETVGEAALDVEWAHAIAPGASIVVYDAAPSFQDLMVAMQQASELPGVSVVSLSYSEPESFLNAAYERALDVDFTTPGVTFLASSGDYGIYGNGGSAVAANYPAASPDVVSVGGTAIVIDSSTGAYPGTGPSSEVAWGEGTNSGTAGGGGGGLSAFEPEPEWQSATVPASIDPSGARALPDVAMDSGAAQEYDVFTSTLSADPKTASGSAVGWLGDAGTSAAAPIWAGLIAIADQGRALAGGTPLTGCSQTLPALYSLPAVDFHDITIGNNGDPAGPGYDLATGLGTPVANLLIPDLAAYEIPSKLAIKIEPPASAMVGTTFGLTVEVNDRFGNPATGGTVTVALGNNPGNATLGGTLTEPVENGVANFSNLTLSQSGAGYTLTVTDRGIAGGEATTSPMNVRAQVIVIGERPVFRRKLNERRKPTGKAVLTGFTLDFSMPLSGPSVLDPENYALDTVALKKGKKHPNRVLHPIKSFTVTYTPTTNSVTLVLAATQSFPTGGQITVLSGVTADSGSLLTGITVFKITPGGKKLEPS